MGRVGVSVKPLLWTRAWGRVKERVWRRVKKKGGIKEGRGSVKAPSFYFKKYKIFNFMDWQYK